MKLLTICHDMRNNAVGRAYVIWLLAQQLGWQTRVMGPARGRLWAPAVGTPFAQDCVVNPARKRVLELAEEADVLVAVKSWPRSFGAGKDLSKRTGTPLLLDIDDPDYEAMFGRLADGRARVRNALVSMATGKHPVRFRRLQDEIATVPRTVSNPVLQRWHGGTLVPHVRPAGPPPVYEGSREHLWIGFIGTPRRHKGLARLRRIVDELPRDSVTLTVTGPRPHDARPWEDWVGTTSLEDARGLLDAVDVVVIPSEASSFGPAQLPVKVVDAMLAGRPIVASNLEPLAWALGSGGILVQEHDDAALLEAIGRLRDPRERQRLGTEARARALRHFTPAAVAPKFADVVSAAEAAVQ